MQLFLRKFSFRRWDLISKCPALVAGDLQKSHFVDVCFLNCDWTLSVQSGILAELFTYLRIYFIRSIQINRDFQDVNKQMGLTFWPPSSP